MIVAGIPKTLSFWVVCVEFFEMLIVVNDYFLHNYSPCLFSLRSVSAHSVFPGVPEEPLFVSVAFTTDSFVRFNL